MTILKCKKCQNDKPTTEFYKERRTKRGYNAFCKECAKKAQKIWVAQNRERARKLNRDCWERHQIKYRRGRMLKRYGITIDQYMTMINNQQNLCAICNNPPTARRLHIDHDHKTGVVRGLLCHSCNVALGLLNENIITLNRMIEYVEKHHGKKK